ncbi:peptidoglycan-binding domain-containing protein [Crossiella sp. CA198]|uniref:peptidoglycan-binding domain-containing protein n=1 Tax=Crossiella sp. CA198 TaxID=3455607 RepID=UPI003F8D2AC5
MSSNAARAVQVRINLTGLVRVRVDGVFGPVTASALRRVQAHCGLPVTGALDDATTRALGLPTAQ